MRKAAGGWLARATNYYRRRSIQFLISLSFSIAAMAGMLFLGFALYLRFAASTEAMVREENKRVIDQVNINLDVYLRNMMRVSDAMYYRVIKSADLADESIHQQMDLLYETNRDLLVSLWSRRMVRLSARRLSPCSSRRSTRLNRNGLSGPWTGLKICISPRRMCRTCSSIRDTITGGSFRFRVLSS